MLLKTAPASLDFWLCVAVSAVLLSSDSSQNAAVHDCWWVLSGLTIVALAKKAKTERSLVYFCISFLVIYDPAALHPNLAATSVED